MFLHWVLLKSLAPVDSSWSFFSLLFYLICRKIQIIHVFNSIFKWFFTFLTILICCCVFSFFNAQVYHAQEQLWTYVELILYSIIESAPDCPELLCGLFNDLRACAIKHFPGLIISRLNSIQFVSLNIVEWNYWKGKDLIDFNLSLDV